MLGGVDFLLNLWIDFKNYDLKIFVRAKEGDFMGLKMTSYDELSDYGKKWQKISKVKS